MFELSGEIMPSDLKFTCDDVYPEKGSSVVQMVITAQTNGTKLVIAKGIPSDKMYQKGLEKNHKPLVDMGRLFEGLADLLSAYAATGNFNGSGYLTIMSAYKPYIDKNMKFNVLKDRLLDANEGGIWE